jgi:transposase
MRHPIFVRSLTNSERDRLKAGLRSPDGFELRRCQIILASARGEHAMAIAQSVGCSYQLVRGVIKAFNLDGLQVLQPKSRRPHKIQTAFSAKQAERLKEILHQSPWTFGKPRNVWTCELAAEVSYEQRLIQERISGETIRVTLKRMGVKWAQAKRWVNRPGPEYNPKKRRDRLTEMASRHPEEKSLAKSG